MQDNSEIMYMSSEVTYSRLEIITQSEGKEIFRLFDVNRLFEEDKKYTFRQIVEIGENHFERYTVSTLPYYSNQLKKLKNEIREKKTCVLFDEIYTTSTIELPSDFNHKRRISFDIKADWKDMVHPRKYVHIPITTLLTEDLYIDVADFRPLSNQLKGNASELEILIAKLVLVQALADSTLKSNIQYWISSNYDRQTGDLLYIKKESEIMGIPQFVIDGLPKGLIEITDKEKEYTPVLVWEHIVERIRKWNIYEFAERRFVPPWKEKFEQRYANSTNRNLLMKEELRIHDKNDDFDMLAGYGMSEKSKGYRMAFLGENPTLADCLLDFDFQSSYTGYTDPDRIENSITEDYQKILSFWNKLMRLAEGFAHSLFEQYLRNFHKKPKDQIPVVEKGIKKEDKEIIVNSKKLNWLGTPSEFGAIISQLIEKGYLEGYPTTAATCKVMMEIFAINKATGEEIAVRTLEDYFGRNKKEPNSTYKLNIPFSDNYGKA